jgi:hypothetical protein
MHAVVLPLRQAFYHKLGVTAPMRESWPEWDPSTETVYWTDLTVEPDGKLSFLLNDPKKALNYFSDHLQKPDHMAQVGELEWNNHLFALSALICELFNHLEHKPIYSFLGQL